MKKSALITTLLITPFFAFGADGLYSSSVKDLNSKTVKFSKYKGKTLLIVNTATGCGYTPQLKGMQALAKKYEGSKFEVLGFPSNSFKQESLEGDKIKKFCFLKYGAKFTLFEKSDVVGENINPVFKYLIKNSSSPKEAVSWNFEKFVLGPDGKVLGRFKSSVKPDDEKILALIEKSIGKEL
jgi:glutathione peroxidase